MTFPSTSRVTDPVTRRDLLARFGACAALAAVAGSPFAASVSGRALAAQTARPTPGAAARRYRISACDWMMLKRQKLGAVKLAADCGFDGVEVDFGGLGDRETFDNKLLSDESLRAQYFAALAEHNIAVSSMAMSAFYAQSFAERPTIPRMIDDCVETMRLMKVKTAFLPLGVRSDLQARPELRPAVVERLKLAGEKAEKAGVVIGIETALDAAGDVALLEEVGSPAIRVYYNFANALQNGRDVSAELRTLGKDRICQIHCTDQDGVLLEQNTRLKLPDVRKALDDMGWSGWLVVERSRDAGKARDVRYNFSANARYLKSVFQS